jgi:hypothetical protein
MEKSLVDRNRYLSKEATLHSHKHGSVVLWLFNDMVLFGKPDLLKKTKILDHIPLNELELKDSAKDECNSFSTSSS